MTKTELQKHQFLLGSFAGQLRGIVDVVNQKGNMNYVALNHAIDCCANEMGATFQREFGSDIEEFKEIMTNATAYAENLLTKTNNDND